MLYVILIWLLAGLIGFCWLFFYLFKRDTQTANNTTLPYTFISCYIFFVFMLITFCLFTKTNQYGDIREYFKDKITSVKLGEITLELRADREEPFERVLVMGQAIIEGKRKNLAMKKEK